MKLCIVLLFFNVLIRADSFFMYNTFFELYRKLKVTYNENQYRIKKYKEPSEILINTPGGLHGFYTLGVNAYIKERYDLSNHVFSGASAGAWNSLFLSFKGNDTEFIMSVLNAPIQNARSIVAVSYTHLTLPTTSPV